MDLVALLALDIVQILKSHAPDVKPRPWLDDRFLQ